MQIMIDIPNWLYNAIMEHREPVYSQSLGDAVRNGTPLPKGHGRLIDISPYEEYFNTEISYDDGNHIHTKYTNLIPTIIEADKAKSDASNFESEEYIEQRLENYDKMLKSGIFDCVIDEVTGKRG